MFFGATGSHVMCDRRGADGSHFRLRLMKGHSAKAHQCAERFRWIFEESLGISHFDL